MRLYRCHGRGSDCARRSQRNKARPRANVQHPVAGPDKRGQRAPLLTFVAALGQGQRQFRTQETAWHGDVESVDGEADKVPAAVWPFRVLCGI
jgi:hypothetical protein